MLLVINGGKWPTVSLRQWLSSPKEIHAELSEQRQQNQAQVTTRAEGKPCL